MIVAFDLTKLDGDSKSRGIGTYTENLINAISESKDIKIKPFSGKKIPAADLVHFPYFDLFFNTLKFKNDIPSVVTIHDVIPLIFKQHFPAGIKGKINLRLQKFALRRVDKVITVSKISKNDIYRELNYPLEKINVIYEAPSKSYKQLDAKSLAKVESKYKFPQNFFLYVGDVNWNKNLTNLVLAIKRTGINLVMVGKALTDTSLPEVQKLNQLLKELKIEQHVTRTGFINSADLCAIYNLANATIVPSFYEGFGLPALESMACATPVLCSNNSSLKEITSPVSLTFNPQDVESIARVIEDFNGLTPGQLKNIRRKSLNHAKQFTWEKTALQTINVYRSIFNDY